MPSPIKKRSRTISGVTPVAVMAKPMVCPGHCVYCPTYSTAPQSYTPESPAVQRARACDYDAFKQTEFRLRILTEMGHPTDKVELIVMGGTFLAAPEEYQFDFIKACYDALNGVPSRDLEEAKTLNESARNRCVGLCIETRPDWCGEREIARMLRFGATRVELGVQMLDDEIYRTVRRGHTVDDVIAATRLLKDYGFKVHYHWMPGLPGSSPDKDLALSKRLFADPQLRPDGLKIYPTMVVEGTELEKWFQDGRYRPYDNDLMTGLVAAIKAEVPRYVRISRVLRDIPSKYIVGGLKDSLRDVVRERMKQSGTQCVCIRCREYGHRTSTGFEPGEPSLTRLDYSASGGKEVFLSFEDSHETLFGLLRLRIQDTCLSVVPSVPTSPLMGESRPQFGIPYVEDPVSRRSRGAQRIGNEIGKRSESEGQGDGAMIGPSNLTSPSMGEDLEPVLSLPKDEGELFVLSPPVAIVRELHVYGPELSLSQRSPSGPQHRGLGHALLAEAERLARDEFGASHLAVLSAVGAKPYYTEAGYRKMGSYMVKAL